MITQIHISGFAPVLCVPDGKKIQNWTNGLRRQVIMESSRLRSLARTKFALNTVVPSQEILKSNEPEVAPNPLAVTWPPALENCDGYLPSLEKRADQEDGEITISDFCVSVEASEVK
jgi:hypothetical protein